MVRIEREDNDVSFCEVDLGNAAPPENKVRVLPNSIGVVVPAWSPQELGNVLREAARCLG